MRGTTFLMVSIFGCLYLRSCDAKANWTAEEESSICSLASEKIKFCSVKGAADENCKKISEKVGGTSPTCSDQCVCSFTKGGESAYVSSKSSKAGYEVLRNCVNNIGIVEPNPKMDLSDLSQLAARYGNEGNGTYEATTLTKHRLCNDSMTDTILYCQSLDLKNDLIRKFHPEKRLGNILGGVCVSMTRTNGITDTKSVLRCVFEGTFYSDTTQTRDICRFHFFNHGTDSAICVMSYWGNSTISVLNDG